VEVGLCNLPSDLMIVMPRRRTVLLPVCSTKTVPRGTVSLIPAEKNGYQCWQCVFVP
jgi:hypothetical protein